MTRIKKPLPVEPEPFQWWYSRDEEGPWEPGGDTREIAISEALGTDTYVELPPGELDDQPEWMVGFYVCRMRRRVLDLSQYFDAADWLADIGDQMTDEDGPDEDGDHHPLEGLTRDQVASLDESVRLAIWHWQQRHGLKLSPWYLESQGQAEWVLLPHPNSMEGM